jgi:hypothetical protein
MKYFNFKPPLGTPLNMGHPLSKGLVGCWLMNEGSGNKVYDLSGNNNVGNLVGGAHFVSGKFGSALSLVGGAGNNDRVNTLLELGSLTSASGMIWCKPEALEFRYLFSDYYTTRLYLRDGSRFRYKHNAVTEVDSSATITSGQWYCFAYSWNGAVATLYQNGVVVGSGACTGALAARADDDDAFSIGTISKYGIAGENFEGIISHGMMYNRALSASEIAQLYRKPFCMFDPEPIELWAASIIAGPKIPVFIHHYQQAGGL